MRVDLGVLERDPDFAGSVQEMWRVPVGGQDMLLARALDGGSVFDIGQFFTIPGSGEARNTLRHNVYVLLADPATWQDLTAEDVGERLASSAALARLRRNGAVTHHVGLVDADTGEVAEGARGALTSALVLVRAFPVLKPPRGQLLGETVYDYTEYLRAPRKVMALEHIVRLGVPGGSSMYDRYRRLVQAGEDAKAAAFVEALGLSGELKPWTFLPEPSVEWTTKYEDYDRHLSHQESALISGGSVAALAELADLLVLYAAGVAKAFRQGGLRLWDLKWEVADEDGTAVLVDTMDHDSARITGVADLDGQSCHVHFNKQAVRDYFRILHGDWHAALSDAKQRSANDPEGRTFMAIYEAGAATGEYPPFPAMDPEFAALQGDKYWYATDATAGKTDPGRCADLAAREARFYAGKGHADDFLKRNAVAQ
jgi:phosphoribosylaminoimidazole-succinocarboxamide synthase